MQFSIVTLLALQAIGVIAAPVAAPAADYTDLAKANIIIKSAGTYKRGEEYAELAKDSIKIKSVTTY
ncbi:hypothetical protein LX32DRAFT_633281 [Colletotrichum zoysiae]|uniref:Pectate lyase n=1 Tax=Colletotrichum zoysiae TaxID=1216348 RepID=A0AAD9M807_9PEZI|nr:hypothetical protein LX32DRAFT_633281 [Colletotrichum zoysiae]